MYEIKELISHSEELSRLMSLVGGITVIEYDGGQIQGSEGLHEYLSCNGILTDVVGRIIVCGKSSERLRCNVGRLQSLFPTARIETTGKEWHATDFTSLNVLDTLVFHMAVTVVSEIDLDNATVKGKRLQAIVRETRNAYYALVFSCKLFSFEFDGYSLKTGLSLSDFEWEESLVPSMPSDFCRDRQAFLKVCEEKLIPKDVFFQCAEEVGHGCEECNQCGKYGKRKQCPIAQRKIAEFYRRGMYVPKNERIAHQWELMASRQGYQPARIQVADDLAEGSGCTKSLPAALAIYREYAWKNDEGCVSRILRLAGECDGKEKLMAVPFIALQAKDGDEDQILWLSNAFQNGDCGLPKDMVQQEEWIRQGAENGNPRFVKAMAGMYEANEDWTGAYKWYKRLSEVGPDMLPEGKLEEVELKMLTHGATDEEIARKGMDYLYGYHGIARDTRLASRCLSYAADKGNALAEGLLGQMYFKGMGVEKDEARGARLILSASDAGDLLSMESVAIDLCPSGFVTWPTEDIPEEEEFDYCLVRMADAIEVELGRENPSPIARYLKAVYHDTAYSLTDEVAFRLMSKAAESDYPPAQYCLARMYEEGRGTAIDKQLYRHWLEKAADNGHDAAECEYGKSLFSSWMPSDTSRTFRYLRNAFVKGYEDDEMCWFLAQCYMWGFGTAMDKQKAYPMYINEAEKGNADAQEQLCKGYFNGNEVLEKNYAQCARWGEEAVRQGKKSVRFETAYSLAETGNKARAYELYQELADEGNVAAMNNLGCLETEENNAYDWFLKAADKGDEVAMKNVARYYRYGIGVKKDESKALEYYKKSAGMGYLGAIKELAQMYRYGYCTEKNPGEAVKWYKRAFDKGDDDSLMHLASLYSDELKDVDMAIQYYKQAAEKGLVVALFRLGEIYEWKGNIDSAIFWYRKAAAQKDGEAKDCLRRLGANWIEDGELKDGSRDDGQNDDNDDLPF